MLNIQIKPTQTIYSNKEKAALPPAADLRLRARRAAEGAPLRPRLALVFGDAHELVFALLLLLCVIIVVIVIIVIIHVSRHRLNGYLAQLASGFWKCLDYAVLKWTFTWRAGYPLRYPLSRCRVRAAPNFASKNLDFLWARPKQLLVIKGGISQRWRADPESLGQGALRSADACQKCSASGKAVS